MNLMLKSYSKALLIPTVFLQESWNYDRSDQQDIALELG